MTKIVLNKFDGGIVNDPRDTSSGVSRVVSNFDVSTRKGSLVPYRSSEDGNTNAANDTMQNWAVALRTGSTYSLYGLGRVTASNKVRIFYKSISTGGSSDLSDNTWTETANNVSATQVTPSYECFVYYKRTGMLYGGHAGRYIWEYDPTGSVAFNETDLDLTSYTSLAQGLVHSLDDILYIPYDNKIASNNNGSWTPAALTLPAQYKITSICEYNSYIAIAAAPKDGTSNSRVFIWDRSSTLATLTENIDWGYGLIKVLEEIDGYLVGISLSGGIGGVAARFNDRITFRYFTGAGSITATELLGATSSILNIGKQKINNRLFFSASISLNGAVRDGVWSFGKGGSGFTLIHERTPNNDTALSSGTMQSFFYVGDYLFQAFITSGANAVTKTNDQATYSSTSIFESTINPGMPPLDRVKLKQLTSISIGYSTAASGQVVVKYKVDGGSYTTICTCTTSGVNVFEFNNASGVPFTKGREYEFRIESTLGAEIINFEYDYSVIPTLS